MRGHSRSSPIVPTQLEDPLALEIVVPANVRCLRFMGFFVFLQKNLPAGRWRLKVDTGKTAYLSSPVLIYVIICELDCKFPGCS